MVPMQVGFLRIYKMKLSSYDNNFKFVNAQRIKQYIAASLFVIVVCFVLRVILGRKMKKG